MIPKELRKKLISIWGTDGVKRFVDKWKTLREIPDHFDSYDKFDVEWLMDGIYGEKQDLEDEIKALAELYNDMVEKRNEKWGDDYEP